MAGRPETARGIRTAQDMAEDVGPQLRARREAEHLSLRELADRIGISPSALSQIETGRSRPSVSTLYAIVSELGISFDELFADRPEHGGARAPARHPATKPGEEQIVQRAED